MVHFKTNMLSFRLDINLERACNIAELSYLYKEKNTTCILVSDTLKAMHGHSYIFHAIQFDKQLATSL